MKRILIYIEDNKYLRCVNKFLSSSLEILVEIKFPLVFTMPAIVLMSLFESGDIISVYKPEVNSHRRKPVDFGKLMEVEFHIELNGSVVNKPIHISHDTYTV